MVRTAGRWFMQLSRLGKVGVVTALLIGLSVVNSASHNATAPQAKPISPLKPETSLPQTTLAHQPVIEHKTITTNEPIAYTSSQTTSSSLAVGVKQVQTAGKDGIRTHTYDVTYSDGQETARTETSNIVTTAPINEVVVVGTYAAPAEPTCSNGSYVNAAGNRVCNPYESSSAPAGATAQCRDGSYSFSQSRSGTCSHHGGVETWL